MNGGFLLQDELTPDVSLEEITILKEEIDKLYDLIKKKSILRYGNVIESDQWEKIKDKI